MQDHYNLLAREEEREMIPLCLGEGVGTVVWSPLARGRLARPWEAAKSTARAETDGGYADLLYALFASEAQSRADGQCKRTDGPWTGVRGGDPVRGLTFAAELGVHFPASARRPAGFPGGAAGGGRVR